MLKRILKYLFLYILPGLLLLSICVLEFLSLSAPFIFNRAMEQQDMLRGTVTVERIHSDLTGFVHFENLEWKSPVGGTLLFIPDGSFRVRLWDVVTQNIKSTTIQELTLNNAVLSLYLNKDMKLDFIHQSPEAASMGQVLEKHDSDWEKKASFEGKSEEELLELGKKKRMLQELHIRKEWQNFNQEGKRLKLALNLNRCMIELFYKDRHYLLSSVHFKTNINTNESMQIQAYAGRFGGTMVGDGMSVHGSIDFTSQPDPECNLAVLFQNVDPSSLGFGLNIHDKMTLKTHFSGPITKPIGTGTVQMDTLHLPGLKFSDVEGDIYYENARLDFNNVKARVYGGTLTATGDYNIDTRYYHISGIGENLRAQNALPKSKLYCLVHLNLYMESKGGHKTTTIRGDFESGPGKYRWVPFDHLQGSFTSAYHNLQFQDVAITFGSYTIFTDAFSIVDKKLHMQPIQLIDPAGQTVMSYQARDAEHPKARLY